MPPASRGLHLLHRSRFHHQTVQSFRSGRCRQQTLIPPKPPPPPKESIWKKVQEIHPGLYWSQLRSARIWTQIRAPFRALKDLIMRIPAPYRRFIGNVMIWLPITSVAIMHCPWQIMHTNGSSMSPFLNPNNSPHLPETKDKLLVERIDAFRPTRTDEAQPVVKRGEIIVFWTPHDPTKVAVKRVVGIAGDIVTPLPGFDGPAEVVVQHNHIWVEGDVDDREKSRDSNWYGQITQNLVIGRVRAVLEPFWQPQWLNIAEHSYPAKRKGRVAEGAVAVDQLDPHRIDGKQFLEDSGLALVEQLTNQRKQILQGLLTRPRERDRAAHHYFHALNESIRQESSVQIIAKEVVERLASIFKEAGFEPVLDEHKELHLVPNEYAKQRMEELRMRPEREIDDETIIKKEKKRYERAFQAEEHRLQDFEQWSWYERYRPKSVLEGQLKKRKKRFEEETAIAERDLEEKKREEAMERSHLAASTVEVAKGG